MVKKLLGHFMKKNYKRIINKNLELKKYLKERVINYMSNEKDDNSFNSWINQKDPA